MDTLLPGIRAERLVTSRLTVNMLSIPDRTGPAVLFVHGNVSSSLFWQPMMLALPEEYQPLALDLRGFGDTDDEPIDATRGCAILPTTWPPPSWRSAWTGCTWSAGAWAAGSCCSTWWTGRARSRR